MNRVLVIDNYDSFTYNLVQIVREELAAYQSESQLVVRRNDKFELSEVAQFDGVILSPGPGLPADAGLMPELVRSFYQSKPILGICLGHQCIAEQFGASLYNLDTVFHGKETALTLREPDNYLFRDLGAEQPSVGLYHSWAVRPETIRLEKLAITCTSREEIVMGIRVQDHPLVQGLQFHPESILTPSGSKMINNWLNNDS